MFNSVLGCEQTAEAGSDHLGVCRTATVLLMLLLATHLSPTGPEYVPNNHRSNPDRNPDCGYRNQHVTRSHIFAGPLILSCWGPSRPGLKSYLGLWLIFSWITLGEDSCIYLTLCSPGAILAIWKDQHPKDNRSSTWCHYLTPFCNNFRQSFVTKLYL